MQTLAHRKLRSVCKQEMKGIIRMKRADDFEVRRQHIANLTDEELYQRFWELTDKVVDPLLELGKKNTTPSVDCMPIVNHAMDHGLMGKGCGHCVYKLSKLENISIREASIKLAQGEGWDKVAAAFKEGK